MTWYMYIFKIMTTIKLVNTFITLCNYNCVCVCMVSTLHIYYLAAFKYTLLTIVTILYLHTHTHRHTLWVYPMEYYSAIKKKAIQPFVTTGRYLEGSVLKKSEKDCDFTYMWNLKKLNSQKQRVQWWLPWPGGWGMGRCWPKCTSF